MGYGLNRALDAYYNDRTWFPGLQTCVTEQVRRRVGVESALLGGWLWQQRRHAAVPSPDCCCSHICVHSVPLFAVHLPCVPNAPSAAIWCPVGPGGRCTVAGLSPLRLPLLMRAFHSVPTTRVTNLRP